MASHCRGRGEKNAPHDPCPRGAAARGASAAARDEALQPSTILGVDDVGKPYQLGPTFWVQGWPNWKKTLFLVTRTKCMKRTKTHTNKKPKHMPITVKEMRSALCPVSRNFPHMAVSRRSTRKLQRGHPVVPSRFVVFLA